MYKHIAERNKGMLLLLHVYIEQDTDVYDKVLLSTYSLHYISLSQDSLDDVSSSLCAGPDWAADTSAPIFSSWLVWWCSRSDFELASVAACIVQTPLSVWTICSCVFSPGATVLPAVGLPPVVTYTSVSF